MSREVLKGFFNLDLLPSKADEIDLYIFEEPVKVSLKTDMSFQMLVRDCSRIGILPSWSKFDIWIPFSVQMNLDLSSLNMYSF